MPQVSHDMLLPLAPNAVWAVLTTTTLYPEWNPKLPRIDGTFGAGKTVTLHYVAERPWLPHRFVVHVDVCDGRQLRWSGPRGPRSPLRQLLNVSHFFTLHDADTPGATRLTHGETFTGPLAGVLWPVLKSGVQAGHRKVNAALVARCDALNADGA